MLDPKFTDYTDSDQKLRQERHALLVDVTADMDGFRFYLAAEKLYHYTWHQFADKILEESKPIFESSDANAIASRQQLLLHTIIKLLTSLHPFMPFITEELWQIVHKGKAGLLMIAPWQIK